MHPKFCNIFVQTCGKGMRPSQMCWCHFCEPWVPRLLVSIHINPSCRSLLDFAWPKPAWNKQFLQLGASNHFKKPIMFRFAILVAGAMAMSDPTDMKPSCSERGKAYVARAILDRCRYSYPLPFEIKTHLVASPPLKDTYRQVLFLMSNCTQTTGCRIIFPRLRGDSL